MNRSLILCLLVLSSHSFCWAKTSSTRREPAAQPSKLNLVLDSDSLWSDDYDSRTVLRIRRGRKVRKYRGSSPWRIVLPGEEFYKFGFGLKYAWNNSTSFRFAYGLDTHLITNIAGVSFGLHRSRYLLDYSVGIASAIESVQLISLGTQF